MIHTSDKEILDVINEQDMLIEKKTRDEIHNKGLLHREIHVWFFDSNGNIFFQKRGVEKSSGGLLDATVGGHVDSGEDYLVTAIRETKEEIGISINPHNLFLLKKFRETSYDQKKKTINNFLRAIYIYTSPISESEIIKENSVLGVDFKKIFYKKLQDLDKNMLAKFDQYIIDEAFLVKKYLDKYFN